MSNAINTSLEQIFNSEHLSYHSNNDIDSVDESRTIPPSGLVLNTYDTANSVETQISKADTGELKQHDMISIFTQVGKWIDYTNSEIEDYTLYKI